MYVRYEEVLNFWCLTRWRSPNVHFTLHTAWRGCLFEFQICRQRPGYEANPILKPVKHEEYAAVLSRSDQIKYVNLATHINSCLGRRRRAFRNIAYCVQTKILSITYGRTTRLVNNPPGCNIFDSARTHARQKTCLLRERSPRVSCAPLRLATPTSLLAEIILDWTWLHRQNSCNIFSSLSYLTAYLSNESKRSYSRFKQKITL